LKENVRMSTNPEQTDDLDQLKRALVALKKARARVAELEQARSEPIAIVGIGCRLPGGVAGPEEFWQLLRNGSDAITEVPAERWDPTAFSDPDPEADGKMPTSRGGYLDQVDRFDPHFFGIAPREAAAMDPQQRLVLETAWEALEDAGIAPTSLGGSATGVFIGIGLNDYQRLQVPEQNADPTLIDTYTAAGNALCISANRLSYTLDLRGPSMAVDTACSSSLVAVLQAVRSLRNGESNLALVGGSNLILTPAGSVSVAKFLSPDGWCKFGDARANGYVRGEGIIMLVLKTLSRAQADNDPIYALIRGGAINQDGYSSGLTVPNGVAQQAMLREALQQAGVTPDQVDYIEAHGTGTALGDPIEINALGAVFGNNRTAERPLLIGSVKTNIGHLEAGAGIAGLVKLALALKHGAIPPSLHYEHPNPHIAFEQLGVRVNTDLTPWPTTDHPAMGGVSSFGFGGTNAHVILEAPPAVELPSEASPPAAMLALSARTNDALHDLARHYADYLANTPAALNTICGTAAIGRTHFSQRLAVVAHNTTQMREHLLAAANGATSADIVQGQTERTGRPKIAFLFTGQGAQYLGMGRELYAAEPIFRATLDTCDRLLQPHLGRSLLDLIFADPADPTRAELLDQTVYTQPALFAIEYALARLWQAWGIEPDAMLGHSVGEYVAACLAGVFSLEDGLRLIAARGRLMHSLPGGGAMLALAIDEARAQELVTASNGRLAIAALNEPESIVISGYAEDIDVVQTRLTAEGVRTRRLTVSHAFHSALMDPILDTFEQEAGQIRYAAPTTALISNVSGQFWDADTIPDAHYWRRHLRESVRFTDGVAALQAHGCTIWIEIGPAPILAGMASRCVPQGTATFLPSLRANHPEPQQIRRSLAALYTRGINPDWHAIYPDCQRRHLGLPTYPFQRESYWFRYATHTEHLQAAHTTHPLLGRQVRSPMMSGTLFEQAFSAAWPALLADHRVFGTPVFPATAYVEMIRAATSTAFRSQTYELSELLIGAALPFPNDEPRPVQVILQPEGDGLTCRVVSAADPDGPWQTHASGNLRPYREPDAPPDDLLETARTHCSEEVAVDEFYTNLDAIGMRYTGAFRSIDRIQRGDSAALVHVALKQPNTADQVFQVHPALLDACLQGLAAALPEAGTTVLYLPISLEDVVIAGRLDRTAWAYATIEPAAEQLQEARSGSVWVFNEDGHLIVRIGRIRLKRVTPAALNALIDTGTTTGFPTEWHYTIAWHSHDLPQAGETAPGDRWLICADRMGLGQALAQALIGQGSECTVVQATTTGNEMALPVIDPNDPQAFVELARQPWRGVIYLWGLNDTRPGSDQPGTTGLLHLAQSLAGNPTRLWIVTREAWAVEPGAPAHPEQALLWGQARVIRRELPALSPICIDLEPAASDTAAALLLPELLTEPGEDEIAYRDGKRICARLVPVPALATERPSDDRPVQLEIRRRGVIDNLELRPMQRRAPAAHEVEIRVVATGLNFRDVLNVLEMYPGEAGPLGHECAGIVTAVGAEVQELAVGDEVLAVAGASFGTYAVTDARLCVRKPHRISFAEAATIPITFLTAAYALRHLARLQPGEKVLIHAAAGGVGMAAIQIAHLTGAEVYATAGTPVKRAFLQAQGIRHIYDSRTLAFSDAILDQTDGTGVDVVLNSLAGEFIPQSLRVLRNGGRFLEIGKRDVWQPEQVADLERDLAYWIIYVGEQCEREPALIGRLLQEIVADLEAGRLEPLPLRAFPLRHAADAFRFMAQARHIGKIVLTQHGGPLKNLRPDATYLISGGLGGLGQATARHLVERGARTLALVGRSAPGPEAEAQITAIRNAGIRVEVFQADLAQREEVARVLATIAADLPPLRGIFHAAGTLADAVIAHQTPDHFKRVFGPKVDATLHLHDLTHAQALDMFVLYSAGAALIGPPGQMNYAAANAFLDGLAQQRQHKGLPALAINWGPWSDFGMAAGMSDADQRRLAEQGLGMLTPVQGLAALDVALQRDESQQAMLPIDWSRFARQLQSDNPPSLFADLLEKAEQNPDAETPVEDIATRLQATPANRRRNLLLTIARDHAGRVLGMDSQRIIDPEQPLQELGLDSLMAVELRNSLSHASARSLPATLLFDYPTLAALADFLLAEFVVEPTTTTEPAHTAQRDRQLDELAQLSDEEAEALLLAELEKSRKR
jgi:acyl transferase domain-containing protein/NAD(P)-dependent dehydrogenase (short-subunit alcohol dehydrogenase family)/acyl carrier protein